MIGNIHKNISLRQIITLIISAVLLVLSSCSNLKYLEEGQKLYTGSKIKIESEEKIPNKGEINSELDRVLRPRPNEKFLGMRTRLWFYNVAGEDPKAGWRKWMKRHIGRPPVFWAEFDAQRATRLIENRLFNMGFFDAQVSFIPIEKPQKAAAEFIVSLQPAFIISQIHPVGDDSPIAQEINATLNKSILRAGQPYRLDKLRQERERITRHLRDQGYYYFHPDFILFLADTTRGEREVDLVLSLKNNIPANAIQSFAIRNITIDTNHSLDNAGGSATTDSIMITPEIVLLNNSGQFKPSTLQRAVFFEHKKTYNTRDHDLSINHLMGLGVFKFVNIRFNEVHERDTAWLDLNVLLTPMEKKTLSAELRGVSKSNNFAGPGLSASFTDRNLLRGAESFSINIDGAYELLVGGGRKATSLELGVSSDLVIPRFVVPFSTINLSPYFIPKTRISLSFNYMSRTDAFSLSSVRGQFGYQWNNSMITQHRLIPFSFNVFSLGTISPAYEQFFSREVLLRRGLFEQFLLGSEYSYLLNSQLRGRQKHQWYLNYNLDLSGNLLYLMVDGLGLANPNKEGQYSILGQSFSQYARSDFDFRYYLDLGHGKRVVSRLAAGVGMPYGNSSTLPYVKLFTTGGSNSIRAFQPRTVGPGAYNPPDSLRSSFNLFQSGEIKIELNLEYRFDFSKIVKGALFADAGNVWNIREREETPGGQFNSNRFFRELALGAGLGLRLDFTFAILRLDLAMPLAVPYDNSPGYFQPLKPLNGRWLRDNLVLNLAIGYPF
jgi:outer membrane protein insertion porin family